MADHYDTLGAARDASADDLKAAYRRAAAAAHPDREGGSTEAMQRVNVAWAVLGDPERRARYDASGDDGPDVADIVAKQGLQEFFDKAIDADAEDVVGFVRDGIAGMEKDAADSDRVSKKVRLRLERQRKKVKAKTENNIYHQLIDQRLARLDGQDASAARVRDFCKRARALLDDYESVVEKPQDVQQPPGYSSYFEFARGSVRDVPHFDFPTRR